MIHNKAWKMAWAWRHTVVMDWLHLGWQKNHSHTYRRHTGRVCGQAESTEGHFITLQLWTLVGVKLIKALRNGCHTLRYVLSSLAENKQKISHSLYRTLWVRNNIGVVTLSYQSICRRFNTWSISYESRSRRWNLLAGHCTIFKMRGW